nr:immunoglobulin heavy chain junction region [Mus musculus]
CARDYYGLWYFDVW